MTILELDRFRRVYGERVAVEELSFTLEPGQVLGLVGPNGAGKTTTLRAIAGILHTSGGRVQICGRDLANNPIEARRLLAYVPDEPHLFEALTVWEHLMFTASVWDLSGWEPRARELLERFELADRADTPAQALSRGMRQKAALAQAFLHQPALMMLDEPMTGLDPLGMRRLKVMVQAAVAADTACIVSSHQLDLVEDIATHVLVLVQGKCQFLGTLDALRALSATGSVEDAFFALTGAAL